MKDKLAKTIHQQMIAGRGVDDHDGGVCYMAWGATNFKALEEDANSKGGLMFKTNGLKHKGIVVIRLTYMDDYTVSFISDKGHTVLERIYADKLTYVIDKHVEHTDNYQEDLLNAEWVVL